MQSQIESFYDFLAQNLLSFFLGFLLGLISIIPSAWITEIERFWLLILFGCATIPIIGWRLANSYINQITEARREMMLSKIVPRTFFVTKNKKISKIQSNRSGLIKRMIIAKNISPKPMSHFDWSLSYSVYDTAPCRIINMRVDGKTIRNPSAYYKKLEKAEKEGGGTEQIGRLRIPLTPPLEPNKSVSLEWTMEMPNVYHDMDIGEWSSFQIFYPTSDIELELECHEGFCLEPTSASGCFNDCDEPKSIWVRELRTQKPNLEETATRPQPEIINNGKKMTWRIIAPLIGHSYIACFKCREPPETSAH